MTSHTTRVLVTGGAGYIGSHTALALIDHGYDVIVLDDLSSGFAALVPPAARFLRGSCGDPAVLASLFADEQVDALVHFAGSISVAESVSEPAHYYENNVASAARLADAAVRAGVRHILFSSSAAVYGNQGHEPIAEDAPCAPLNPYGRSKLYAEGVLADIAATAGANLGCLRYFNVAGADPAGRSGQLSRVATHLIKVAMETVTGKRPEIRVFGTDYPTPDGTCVRDYVHVSDLAEAHVLALARLVARPGENLTLNCGYGRGHSVLEVLDVVQAVAGKPIRMVHDARRPGDAAWLVADNRRISEVLDWRPRFNDLPTIVQHAMAWEERLHDTVPGA